MSPHISEKMEIIAPSKVSTKLVTLLVTVFVLIAFPTDAQLYQITGSWFRERFSKTEWEKTLTDFTSIGGDTILHRAPRFNLRKKEDLSRDDDFQWCGSVNSSSGLPPPNCFDEAEVEMSKMKLNIVAWASYLHEEDYGRAILECPNYEKVINSSRIYHRLVLPVKDMSGMNCDFPAGTDVVVLFTAFSGIDQSKLLLESAVQHNLSVVLGMPRVPRTPDGKSDIDTTVLPAYFNFVGRLLNDHRQRYGNLYAVEGRHDKPAFNSRTDQTLRFRPINQKLREAHQHKSMIQARPLFDSVIGYCASDDVFLINLVDKNLGSLYLQIYSQLSKYIRSSNKKFLVAPSVKLVKSQVNATLANNVAGFEALVKTQAIDVIIVQEDRGFGRSAYFWEEEQETAIADIDPVMIKVLQYLDPSVSHDSTFGQVFSASNQQLFRALSESKTSSKNGASLQMWLSIDAFEYLRDKPCLPIDKGGSGLAELVDRTTKARMDWAISVAGSHVQKIVSRSWDPGFTCVTETQQHSLAEDIKADASMPVLANCSWHSPYNMSIVLLGFHLTAETQAYTVTWQDWSGKERTNKLYGYYFELDYGKQHGLMPSLEYTMLYDLPDILHVRPHGRVSVKAGGSNHACVFLY